MNREKKYLDTKHFDVKGKRTSTGSSEYNTCSDNPIEDVNIKKTNLYGSLQSIILAGQISPPYRRENTSGESLIFRFPNTEINNESNYSVNVLDQNLDAITENNDTFLDCKDLNQSDSYNDDSTKYLQFGSMSKLREMKSNNYFYANYSNLNKLDNNDETNKSIDLSSIAVKAQIENDRLITIMEETEVTHATNSFFKNQSSINIKGNTKDSLLAIGDECKIDDKINCNKNSLKRVLFANEENDQECSKFDKFKLRKQENLLKRQVSKERCCAQKGKDINENCNTTESFVLWEKFCKSSDKLIPRRSYSFSELNSASESYTGDDEYSTSFKTLDDTYLSNLSFDINDKDMSQKKCLRYRSKSCDSLLKEVKHLPHILYDRFLQCLSKEIDHIRKQSIVCTCQKINKKYSNKENSKRNTNTPKIQISNEKSLRKTKIPLKISPVQPITNCSKLSPEILKILPQNAQNLSPKYVNKTPTTPSKKRGLYSWQKEIVSPVGEYIRGKRQSPFKTSPNKKK